VQLEPVARAGIISDVNSPHTWG